MSKQFTVLKKDLQTVLNAINTRLKILHSVHTIPAEFIKENDTLYKLKAQLERILEID